MQRVLDLRHRRRARGHAHRPAHDDREAGRDGRERRHARRPLDLAHELAGGAVLDLQRVDLARAAVDAQRDVAIVHGRTVGVARRQRLALERDGAVVAADILGVLLAKELGAVLDQEAPEVHVQVIQRLPHLLVDLHAHGDLAAALAHDILDREALPGPPHRLDRDRIVLGRQELEGHHAAALLLAAGVAADGVDEAELVVLRGVLEHHGLRPLARQVQRLHLGPRHLGIS